MNLLYRRKKYFCPLFAFIIPIIIITVVSIVSGFYPYGKYSILMADMRYQFVDYYGYMKNIFFSNDTYYYTFSKTFGGDMAGLAAYYCNNPFLLILLFIPNDILPAGILIMMSIMLGFIGLSFYYFISEIYGVRYTTLIFSTAYAFSGYLMGYFNCTLYYFNIMMLPLVMLGIYRIIKSEKISFLYIISLFLSIFSSYYIGYMTCIFSIMYFVYIFLSEHGSIKEVKNHYKPIIIYICTSIVGVGLSSFSLLSAVFSLQGQKNSGLSLSLSRNFNLPEVFSGFYTSAFHGNVSDGLPLVYCGAISFLFIFLFYTNKKISVIEKVISAAIFFILIISFWIDALNVVWHGFSQPIGFPYRNSFLFIFFMLFLSYRSFLHIKEEVSYKQLLAFAVIYLIYSAYLIVVGNENVSVRQVVITAALLISIAILILLYNKKRFIKLIMPALLLIEICDASYNSYVSINSYFPGKESDESITIDNYKKFVDQTQSIVDSIEAKDTSFYRIEKLYRRSNNDAMLFGYNGLSHFSSCETNQAKRFLGTLGFRDNDNWAFYGDGSTSFADCLMGVKYIISQYDETPKPYDMAYNKEDKYIYYNPYALSLAFGTTDSIENLKYDGNHFVFQNEIAKSISGENIDIYTPVKNVEVEYCNVDKSNNRYKRIDNSQDAYIQYSFINGSDDFIYMFFDADTVQDTKIIVNNLEKQPYFTSYGWSIRELGHYDVGDEVNLRIYLEQEEIVINNYEFYYENKDKIKDWYAKAAATKCELNKETSSHLVGNYNLEESKSIIVVSIPYEEEWSVYIDGQKTPTKKVLDGLLAIEAKPGEHTIEMKYLPKGIKYGVPMSLFFLMVLIYLAYISIHKVVEKE